MKMMFMTELDHSFTMYKEGDYAVDVTYVRERNLTLKAHLFVKVNTPAVGTPGYKGTTQLITTIDWKSRFSTEPLVNALENYCLEKGDDLETLAKAGAKAAADHIKGNRNARKRLNREIFMACNMIMHAFERNPRIIRSRGQLQYVLWSANVIDLEKDNTTTDAEYVKLGFVKYNGGFNLALYYRFLVDEGLIAGKIEISTHQPETVVGLYGKALDGLRLLRKREHAPQQLIDKIVYQSQACFLEDEEQLNELLYRHHTNNV